MTYPVNGEPVDARPRTVKPDEVKVLGWTVIASDVAHVSAARKWAVKQMGAATWPLCDDCLDTLQLITSELVTNAIRYGGGESVEIILIERGRGVIRVEVVDANNSGKHIPHVQTRPGDTQAVGGRGLTVVDQKATAWRFQRDDFGPGKVVWFEIQESDE